MSHEVCVTTNFVVPPRWTEAHKNPDVANTVADLLLYSGRPIPSALTKIFVYKDMWPALNLALRRGQAERVAEDVVVLFGPLAGWWWEEPQMNTMRTFFPSHPQNVFHWRPSRSYTKLIDPWAFATAKPETREHLQVVLSRLNLTVDNFSDAMRRAAFIRTFLTKGAKVAIKRLLPFMHPATRRLFLKSDPVSRSHGHYTIGRYRKVRHMHKSIHHVQFIAGNDGLWRSLFSCQFVDNLVSRFGMDAYRAYEAYATEYRRLNLTVTDPVILRTFAERLNRVVPARYWNKWHDELVAVLDEHGKEHVQAAQAARQMVWDWVFTKEIQAYLDVANIKLKPLITMQDLRDEHEAMRHCIQTYGASTSLLGHVSLNEPGHPSEEATFEFTIAGIHEPTKGLQGIEAWLSQAPVFSWGQCVGPRNAQVSDRLRKRINGLMQRIHTWTEVMPKDSKEHFA